MEPFAPCAAFTSPNTCHEVNGIPKFLFANLVQTVLAAQCSFTNVTNSYSDDYGDAFKDKEEFDFIVVGAGSTGSVIASRLAENPAWRILLIEAGGNPTLDSEIPALDRTLLKSKIDWNYTSIPNGKSCLSSNNGRCELARGKALGGTSTINYMVVSRGNPEDYDEWARFGNKGWSYKDVLPYFKKLENFGIDNFYHSSKGPLTIEDFAINLELEPLKQTMLLGFTELGYPQNEDFTGRSQIGSGRSYGNLYHGTRGNTAKMYLNPRKYWSNLKVIKNALVEKILFNGKEAIGVAFSRVGNTFTAIVKKEVILSAGVFNSPKLLMLSGVGDKNDLENLGIDVVHRLDGVGKNLQDHPLYTGIEVKISNARSKSPAEINDDIYKYLTRRIGPFGGIGLSEVNLYTDSVYNSSVPDLKIGFALDAKQFSDNSTNFSETIQKVSNLIGLGTFVPTIAAIKPKSRGYVKLQSSNPYDDPLIYSNYLDADEDFDTIVRGADIIERLFNTNALAYANLKANYKNAPDCDEYADDKVSFLRCHIRYFTQSYNHPSSTCKMGPRSDVYAVVDEKLRVHGIKRLRIADASVMPSVPRGNINIPCIMIGEKVSDMIKADYCPYNFCQLLNNFNFTVQQDFTRLSVAEPKFDAGNN